MTETVLSPMNLVLLVGIFIGLPVLFLLMMPRGSQIRTVDPALLADPVSPVLARGVEMTPAKRLENSRLILAIVVIFGGFFIVDPSADTAFCCRFQHRDAGRADAGEGPAWPTIFPYPCVQRGGTLIHDFRRSAVRNLEGAGVPRSTSMQITGHKTESVFRRYAIVDEQMHREAAAKLDAWNSEQQGKAAEQRGQVKRFKKGQTGERFAVTRTAARFGLRAAHDKGPSIPVFLPVFNEL